MVRFSRAIFSFSMFARESKYALYDLKLATYEKNHTFNQTSSVGFIELFGLQTKMANQVKINENLE